MRRFVDRRAVVLAVVLVASITPATAAGPPLTDPASDAARGPTAGAALDDLSVAAQSTELRLHQELRLTPDRPGEIEVRLRYEVPDRVTGVVAELPAEASVVSTDGFHLQESVEYEWDGRTGDPTIVYRIPANETGEVRGPEGAEGRYLFVDVGEWAIVELPRVATGWRWTGSERVKLVRSATVDGPGAVGGSTAFLGEHRELRSTAHGQTFRLVVPAAADLEEQPEDVFAAFANAADALRVGDRDETVFAVAAPGDAVEWGARGLQIGDADMWVLDGERLDDPGDTWTHEYVHTRQSFETTPTAAWVTEAMATYYAALLALEDGRVGFDAFRRWLAEGSRSPYRSAVLADPTTWGGVRPDYLKGALVLAELDRQIRLATTHERTAQVVFRRMNERDRPVSGSAFLELVAAAGGEEVRSAAETHTTTSAAPDTWDRDAHERAFGTSPALIDAALAATRVTGSFRNATVDDTSVVLAVGETLAFDTRIQNVGGTAGPYDVTLRVDGMIEANRSGRLAPNETATVTFDRAFHETGTYTVAIGGDRVSVEVVDPATANVVDVRVSATTVRPGETVTVAATVRNDARIPGQRDVVLTRDGTVVGSRTVRLGPGEERIVSIPATFSEPGEYRLEVSDRGFDVRVAQPTTAPEGSPADATAFPSPGIDPPSLPTTLWYVVGAILVALAVLLAHRKVG